MCWSANAFADSMAKQGVDLSSHWLLFPLNVFPFWLLWHNSFVPLQSSHLFLDVLSSLLFSFFINEILCY